MTNNNMQRKPGCVVIVCPIGGLLLFLLISIQLITLQIVNKIETADNAHRSIHTHTHTHKQFEGPDEQLS